jgi:hypothetical protein
MEYVDRSAMFTLYQSLLFSRIVPIVRDIGLWGDRVQAAYADMGVLDNAKADLTALMRQDEEIAERYDQEQAAAELATRQAEVAEAVVLGSE